tara:strand:- start:3523 stop:3756 length:234 start_codon:yes stop_codon:yes gene_type:complete
MNYSDKRIIIHTREPEKNEFIMGDSVLIGDRWLKDLFKYIEEHSNLKFVWLRNNQFANPNMRGFRIVINDDYKPFQE